MKTGVTKFWYAQVFEELRVLPPRLVSGPYGLFIDLPESMNGDIDNRVKLLSDMLTENDGLGVVKDDKQMLALYVGRLRMTRGRCVATLVTLSDWPSHVALRLGF